MPEEDEMERLDWLERDIVDGADRGGVCDSLCMMLSKVDSCLVVDDYLWEDVGI